MLISMQFLAIRPYSYCMLNWNSWNCWAMQSVGHYDLKSICTVADKEPQGLMFLQPALLDECIVLLRVELKNQQYSQSIHAIVMILHCQLTSCCNVYSLCLLLLSTVQ